MSTSPFATFTFKAQRRLSKIVTPVTIHPIDDGGKSVKVLAIWDTGATRTAISERLAESMGITSVGYGIAHTANGQCRINEYLVKLELPGGVLSSTIRCSSFKASDNVDVLIGMDLITTGDFAITNADGKTFVSFRIPPDYRHIDYHLASTKGKAGKIAKDYIKSIQPAEDSHR